MQLKLVYCYEKIFYLLINGICHHTFPPTVTSKGTPHCTSHNPLLYLVIPMATNQFIKREPSL